MLGRHLMEIGAKPGRQFGEILDEAYEAQLDGTFSDVDGGLEFLRQKLSESAAK
jgi:tRNA nucleotidyltransferase (CCA-adding enzyme)